MASSSQWQNRKRLMSIPAIHEPRTTSDDQKELPRSKRSRLWEQTLIIIALGRPRTCAPGTIAYALGFSYTETSPGVRFVGGVLLSFLVSFSANLHNALSDIREDAENLPCRALLLSRI